MEGYLRDWPFYVQYKGVVPPEYSKHRQSYKELLDKERLRPNERFLVFP